MFEFLIVDYFLILFSSNLFRIKDSIVRWFVSLHLPNIDIYLISIVKFKTQLSNLFVEGARNDLLLMSARQFVEIHGIS